MATENKPDFGIISTVEEWKGNDAKSPKKGDKITITLSEEQSARLQECRDEHHFKSKSQAVRWLMGIGLDGIDDIEGKIDELSSELDKQFIRVHDDGSITIRSELLEIPGTCKSIVELLQPDDNRREMIRNRVSSDCFDSYEVFLKHCVTEYYFERVSTLEKNATLESENKRLKNVKEDLDRKINELSNKFTKLHDENISLKTALNRSFLDKILPWRK